MPPRSALVCLLATLVLTGCPSSRPPDPWKQNYGVYWTRVGNAGDQQRIVTLWLLEGGTARLETVYVGHSRQPADAGRWSAVGNEITVSLDGKPPMVFRRVGRELLPDAPDGLVLQQRWPAPGPAVPSMREVK